MSWLIVDKGGRLTGKRVTDEEATVMILAGDWAKGTPCAQPDCWECKNGQVLRPRGSDE